MSLHRFHGLRHFRLDVLDKMPFVQDAIHPIEIGKLTGIVADDILRGDDNVALAQLLESCPTVFDRPGVNDGLKVIGILVNFVKPVVR